MRGFLYAFPGHYRLPLSHNASLANVDDTSAQSWRGLTFIRSKKARMFCLVFCMCPIFICMNVDSLETHLNIWTLSKSKRYSEIEFQKVAPACWKKKSYVINDEAGNWHLQKHDYVNTGMLRSTIMRKQWTLQSDSNHWHAWTDTEIHQAMRCTFYVTFVFDLLFRSGEMHCWIEGWGWLGDDRQHANLDETSKWWSNDFEKK